MELLTTPGTSAPSKSTEWYTPEEIITAARATMGGIDLDPASCLEANRVVGTSQYYTRAEDGLLPPWFGRVWLNPPFGMTDTRAFVNHLAQEFDARRIKQACLLLLYAPRNPYITHLYSRFPHCHLRHKPRFRRPSQHLVTEIAFPVVIFYLGPHTEQFAGTFSALGAVCQPLTPYRSHTHSLNI